MIEIVEKRSTDNIETFAQEEINKLNKEIGERAWAVRYYKDVIGARNNFKYIKKDVWRSANRDNKVFEGEKIIFYQSGRMLRVQMIILDS
ncbi:MAG: hypothetical protein QXX68_02015 [Candidatus Pacearchaeota archaeon]